MGPAPTIATSVSIMPTSYAARRGRKKARGVGTTLIRRPGRYKRVNLSDSQSLPLKDAVLAEVRLGGLVHGLTGAGVATVPRVLARRAGLVPAHRAGATLGRPALRERGFGLVEGLA